MNNYYADKFKIDYGKVDIVAQLRIDHIFEIFQTIATEHCSELGMDYYTLNAKDNAFWVLAKIKILLDEDLPTWGDIINAVTFPNKPGSAKFIRNYYIEKMNKVRPVKAIAEWCVLERGTNRIKRSENLSCYPHSLKHEEDVLVESNFARFDATDFDGKRALYKKKVLLSDLDSNLHMNNVNYAKLVLDCFKISEYTKNFISEIELQYVSQVRLGETICVYRVANNKENYIIGKEAKSGRIVFKAYVVLTKRKHKIEKIKIVNE